jgi:hypothetical protein
MSDFPRFNKSDIFILSGLIIVFVLIPYIPYQLLSITDSFIVRLLLLVLLIATLQYNPFITIATLVILSLLFVERNKQKMQYLRLAMTPTVHESEAVSEIQTPVTAPRQPQFLKPTTSSIPFMPNEESGDDSFTPVAPSMNTKIPLPTETVTGSEKAIQQLFTSVNTNLIEDS